MASSEGPRKAWARTVLANGRRRPAQVPGPLREIPCRPLLEEPLLPEPDASPSGARR